MNNTSYRTELERLDRDTLIARAEQSGVTRARILTRPELIDELLSRAATAAGGRPDELARGGWVAWGGSAFILSTCQWSPLLVALPRWAVALIVPVMLLGLAGWRDVGATRVALLTPRTNVSLRLEDF